MGLFSKKNKNEDISYKSEKNDAFPSSWVNDAFLIPDSEISDKQKEQFMKALEKTRKILDAQGFQQINPLYYKNDDGGISCVNGNPFLPLKTQKENVLWYRIKHAGILDKKIAAFEVVTNFRPIAYDVESGIIDGAMFSHTDDVIVNNQRRISESERNGSSSGFGGGGTFLGNSYGTSTSESRTYGDVVLLEDGAIKFTFYSVADPHGLSSLIKYVLDTKKELIKLEGKIIKEKENKLEKTTDCGKCGTSNSLNSKFCNKCGNKLNSPCGKCGQFNQEGSSFCNSCGFALQ